MGNTFFEKKDIINFHRQLEWTTLRVYWTSLWCRRVKGITFRSKYIQRCRRENLEPSLSGSKNEMLAEVDWEGGREV